MPIVIPRVITNKTIQRYTFLKTWEINQNGILNISKPQECKKK